MEAEKEDTTNIELFWTLFNEVLQKVSGHKEYKFNPLGWCTDMAGGQLCGTNHRRLCHVLSPANFTLKINETRKHRDWTMKIAAVLRNCVTFF